VTNREWVSAESCRLYFTLDYVATFWDMIEIGRCFVERTHVLDDWDGGEDEEGNPSQKWTASKYLLPEPVPINLIDRVDLIKNNPLDSINQELKIYRSKYYLISLSSENGEISTPKIKYQSGA